ncbi:MAG: lytic transglycosylase domain-containing protein [Acidobacteriota bacterium]
MSRLFVASFILLACTLAASAQNPLTPPERSPIPLTSDEQERRLKEERERNKLPVQPNTAAASTIKIPTAVLSGNISSGNAEIDLIVMQAARQFALDPYLIFSLMRQESSFNRGAVSPKGASGLMQLMPATAARFGVKNIFDVRENIFGGSRYLRWLLDRFNGDVRLALAGYNAGEGAVEFYGNKIPPFYETQNYVRIIYTRYANLRLGGVPSPVISEPAKPSAATAEKAPTYNQIIVFTSSSGDGKTAKMQ